MGGEDEDLCDLDVLRSGCSVEGNICDVVARKRSDSLVDILCTSAVAMETNRTEIGLHETRLDVGDADCCLSDVDTETVIGFLRAHGLDKDFKVNIEVNHATLAGHTFEHELACAVDAGMLGSIDANRGDYQNGWDTDQFPIDNYELVQAMMQIIRNGGFGNGGTNFDAKTRRNSTDLEDIFIAHIAGMDVMARALECAADLLQNSPIPAMVKERYSSFDSGLGKKFEDGQMTFEEAYEYGKQVGEPKQTSGKQELYEAIVNMYC